MALRIALTTLMLVCFAASPLKAEPSAEQRQEIEQIVRDYLLANPEIIEEALQALQAKRDQAEAVAQSKAIEENRALIFDSSNQMVLGNPGGEITLVEFFDYNCQYCKRALADMDALLKTNPDLRIVMKEFPILSEGSVAAARLSVAVKDLAPASYLDFHHELFTRPGQATGDKALEIARDLGLDTEILKAKAAGEDVTKNLQEVQTLAQALGITGTPSYIIGTELIPGAAGYDALQAKVEAVRDCGMPIC